MTNKLYNYAELMRLHRPIGILLFLWPTLWGLWIAGQGSPPPSLIVVFLGGVVLMRSAGCIINDLADQPFDGKVKRTSNRPLIKGSVSSKEALLLLLAMALLTANLLWFLNAATRWLTLPLILFTSVYPLMKRFIHFPQAVLGMACNWGIPMAFAAQTGHVPVLAWALFCTACLWSIAYDSIYAMVDRADDLHIGVKSTAIWFGQWDTKIIGLLHVLILGFFLALGGLLNLGTIYYLGVITAAAIFAYEQKLIRNRDPDDCFRAFNLSHWAGAALFFGLLLGYKG